MRVRARFARKNELQKSQVKIHSYIYTLTNPRISTLSHANFDMYKQYFVLYFSLLPY